MVQSMRKGYNADAGKRQRAKERREKKKRKEKEREKQREEESDRRRAEFKPFLCWSVFSVFFALDRQAKE